MKKIISNTLYRLLLLVAIVAISSVGVFAQQGKGKGQKEGKGKVQDTLVNEQKIQGQQKGKDAKEIGQQKTEEKKETAEEAKAKGQEKKHEAKQKEDDESKEEKGDAQGYAYGKNKGDLKGKEFGQARAAEARMNKEVKKKELEETVKKGDEKVWEAKEKVRISKEALDKDLADKKITEEEFAKRKEKIEQTELVIEDLERKIEREKLKEEAL
jgi:colicin import membrane protein